MAGKEKYPDPKAIRRLAVKHGRDANNRFNARDEGLIASAGHAYWTVTDLSLIKVSDLVGESGQLKVEGMLPARYSAYDKERYFVIGKETYFAKALQGVIEWRQEHQLKLLDRDLFAGLNPDSEFFLQDDGSKFDVSYRERANKPALLEPYQMRRHFQKFYLGEGVTWQTLNDAFIMNYWVAKSPEKPAQAVKDLQAMTGLHPNTIRQKCAREETCIQGILEILYR